MEMFYLVIALANREVTLTTIPASYPKEQCEKLKKDWIEKSSSSRAFCVVALPDYYNCAMTYPLLNDPSRGVSVRYHCDITTGKQ